MKLPTPNKDEVIRIARTWLGTPYRHLARERGEAVDCVQFIIAVGEEGGVCAPIELTPYKMINHPSKTRKIIERFCDPVLYFGPGDIAFFGPRPGIPTHFGFLTELHGTMGIIHADPVIGRVVEHTFPEDQLPLIDSIWWFK